MSCYYKNPEDTVITVSGFNKSTDNVVFYDIVIKCSQITWTVKHRYNDFHELNEKLVNDCNLPKDWLPPKKPFEIKSNVFFEKRREALEEYLQKTLHYLQKQMPTSFIEFLDFHKYDIVFLLETMALKFFTEGEQILFKNIKSYLFTSLELYAISERIKMPCVGKELSDSKYAFSHILDFCSQLESIVIIPKKTNYFKFPTPDSDSPESTNFEWNRILNEKIGTSNVVPRSLKFETTVFKSLKSLSIYAVPMENIYNTGNLRETLEHMAVNSTSCYQIKDILLCDSIHRGTEDLMARQAFRNIKTANFDRNEIKAIDESINLLPNLTNLSLEENFLVDIDNLENLCNLTSLNLCNNSIKHFTDWHLKVGNITTLNLSQNQIRNLSGLCKLYSLVYLDLSWNLVEEFKQIDYLSKLPNIKNLGLNGNPLAKQTEYRGKVLSRFGDRISEIILDNEPGTQSEIDLAMVHYAMRLSKMKNDSD